MVLRLLDEEANPGLSRGLLGLHPAFVHLVVPLRHDTTLEGLTAFENERFGVGIDAKFFVLSYHDSATWERARFAATTVLLSGRCERERFPQLGKQVNLMSWTLSLGF